MKSYIYYLLVFHSASVYNTFSIDNAIIAGQDSDGNVIYVGRYLNFYFNFILF